MSFCRITGHARNLPKPNFFPLIPPISPADARKLCRITGKSQSMEDHNYIPVMDMLIEKSKVHCSVVRRSSLNLQSHHYTPSFLDNQSSQVTGCRITQKHQAMAGYQYVYPMIDFDTMNNKEQEELRKIMDAQEEENSSKKFVYALHEEQFGLVLPTTLEQALRKGDIENLMLSKDGVKLMVQVRQGMAVTIPMKTMTQDEMEQDLQKDQLMEGLGPDEEVIRNRPKKKPKQYGKRKTSDSILDHRRRLFEQKEEKVMKEEIAKEKIVEKQKIMRKQSIAKRKETVIEPPKLTAIVETSTPSPQTSDILKDGPNFALSIENQNFSKESSKTVSQILAENENLLVRKGLQKHDGLEADISIDGKRKFEVCDSKAMKEEANIKLSGNISNGFQNGHDKSLLTNDKSSAINNEADMLKEQKLHVMQGFMDGDMNSMSQKENTQYIFGCDGHSKKDQVCNGFIEKDHGQGKSHAMQPNSVLVNTVKTHVDPKQQYSRQYYLSKQLSEDGFYDNIPSLNNNCDGNVQSRETTVNGFSEHCDTEGQSNLGTNSSEMSQSESSIMKSRKMQQQQHLEIKVKGQSSQNGQVGDDSEIMISSDKKVDKHKNGVTNAKNSDSKCGSITNNQQESHSHLSEKARRKSAKEKRQLRKLKNANEENEITSDQESPTTEEVNKISLPKTTRKLSNKDRLTLDEDEALRGMTSSDDTDSELRGGSKKRGTVLKNIYDYHKKKLNKYEVDSEPEEPSTNPWLSLPDAPSIDNSKADTRRESFDYEAPPNKWIQSMEQRLKALVASKDGVSPSTNMNEWMGRLESLSLLPDGRGQKPALLILTKKAKMVVPVEARRDVLLGKRCYFLITDDGIQFYPSGASMELRPRRNKHLNNHLNDMAMDSQSLFSTEDFSDINEKIPLTMNEEFDEIKHSERKRVSPVLKQSQSSDSPVPPSPENSTEDDNAEGVFTPKTEESNDAQSEWISTLQQKLQTLIQKDQVTTSQDLQEWYDSIGSEEDKPALLITKHSLHMVVPIEARRDVVMGKRSYFLVDDRGIKFFPADPQFSSAYSSVDSSFEPSRRSSIAKQIPFHLRPDYRSASRSMSRDRFDDGSDSPVSFSRDSSIDRLIDARHRISSKALHDNRYDKRIGSMIFGDDFYSSIPSYATIRRPQSKRFSTYY